MKHTIFIISLVFIYLSSSAQVEFKGKLVLKDKTVYNYKLVLEEFQKSKVVKGYSITDEHGKHETKTLLKGKYNSRTKRISFEEYQIERTKVKAKDLSFCYVNGELNLIIKGNDTSLAGSFTGKLFPKNDICATGIILLKQEVVKPKVQAKIEREPVVLAPKIVQEEKFELKNYTKLDNNNKLHWNSEIALVEMWDQGNEDGDMVSLYFDGQLVQSNILLSRNKQSFTFKVTKGEEHTISILAENEGKYPPNTAAIIIYDWKQKHLLYNESKQDEMKSLKIWRK